MGVEIIEVFLFVLRALVAWRFWLVFGVSLLVAFLLAVFALPALMQFELHIPISIVGIVGGLAWEFIADSPKRQRFAKPTREVSWWRRGR